MRLLYLKYYVLAWSVLLLLFSCNRRPLEEICEDTALIPIGTVWTQADIKPQNVTALFYSQDDGRLVLEHRFENTPNRIQTYASVPAGKYTVVIFNELRGQIVGVGIRGYENFSTLEAYAIPNPNVRNRSDGNSYVYEPDILASVIVSNFDVTNEMINQTMKGAIEALVGLVPLRKVHQFNIIAHVKGLNNARMPALVDLLGIAESYSLKGNKNTWTVAAQQFTMNNRTYDGGSRKDGVISETIYTLGFLGEQPSETSLHNDSPVQLDFLFMLVDTEKTLVRQLVDVTSLIRFQAEAYGATTFNLYVELPDPLPDVVPEGSGNSGFETEIIDWDLIEVPLNAK
jgi:lipoprotein